MAIRTCRERLCQFDWCCSTRPVRQHDTATCNVHLSNIGYGNKTMETQILKNNPEQFYTENKEIS